MRWSYWHGYLGEVFADTVLHDGPETESSVGSRRNSGPPLGERGPGINKEAGSWFIRNLASKQALK